MSRPSRKLWIEPSIALLGALYCQPARAAIFAAIPAECGSAPELELELRQRLGNDAKLDATRVTLSPDAQGYHLQVVVGSERRELHDASCQELLRAAVVITVALSTPEKRRGEAVPSTPHARSESRSSGQQTRFALAAGGGVDLATEPKAAPQLELDAQLLWARYGIAAGARYLLATATRDPDAHGARVNGAGAYLAGSVEPWPRLQTRVGVFAYRLSGVGLGSRESARDAVWEAGPLLAASYAVYERPPFWLSLGAEGRLNVLPARFEIRDYGQVFRVPLVGGSAFVRLGLIW